MGCGLGFSKKFRFGQEVFGRDGYVEGENMSMLSGVIIFTSKKEKTTEF
jgi:hypothetical protein